jgi:hypothetical protein
MLAATGLIDGRPATTHWGEIDRIERGYPAVRWVRGQRYVDDGQFISTAGILSGIDGALHMIDRLQGRALALEVARAIRYDGARFLDDPSMPQFHRSPGDVIVFLNAAFGWDRTTLGVRLFDGIDELPLASDIPTAKFAAKRRPRARRRRESEHRRPGRACRAGLPGSVSRRAAAPGSGLVCGRDALPSTAPGSVGLDPGVRLGHPEEPLRRRIARLTTSHRPRYR